MRTNSLKFVIFALAMLVFLVSFVHSIKAPEGHHSHEHDEVKQARLQQEVRVAERKPTPQEKTEDPAQRPKGSVGAKKFEDVYYKAVRPDWRFTTWESEDILSTLTTDKPVYRPGDEIVSRVCLFNHTTKEPVGCSYTYPMLTLTNSKEEVVFEYSPVYIQI